MSRRLHRPVLYRSLLSVALFLPALGSCSGGSGTSTAGEVTFPVLYVKGDSGGTDVQKVKVAESGDGSMRVEFSENEVKGIGPMMRAAMWNSASLAVLLSGDSPTKEFSFTVSGLVDGPSAGAVSTAAALAAMRGDKILEKVAMTGTMQPDGSVGPVGGVPEKLKGAAKAGFKKIGVPTGMRNAESEATGELVDVVALGRELNVEVVEISNIYEAYQFLTGTELPAIAPGTNVKLGNTSYDRLNAKASLFLANYKESMQDASKLSDLTYSLLKSLYEYASDAAGRAEELLKQGQVAGAYTSALLAWGYGRSIASAGEVLDALLFDSPDAALKLVGDSRVVVDKVYALVDSLKTYAPKSPSDASALMNAFASAIDAVSLVNFAESQINTVAANLEGGKISNEDAVSELMMPLVYNAFATVQIDSTRELFDAGRDLGTTLIDEKMDLKNLGDLLRKGADANLEAFSSQVIDEWAEKYDRSSSSILAIVADNDLDVALANQQPQVLSDILEYMGKVPAADYAVMGYGINNYARSAQILLKYASNGVVDENFDLASVRSEAALVSALDLGKGQLASNINMLRTNSVEPSLEIGLYESAALDREGTLTEKFSALGKYWTGFLSTRVLAYLAGLQKVDLDK